MGIIFPHLRPLDAKELSLLGPDVLSECFNEGEVFIGWVNREPACVYGVRFSGFLEPALLWLLSTPLIEKHRVSFVKLSTRFVMDTLQRHGTVRAVVMKENFRSVRWLMWLGFEFKGEEDIPPVGPVFNFERSL